MEFFPVSLPQLLLAAAVVAGAALLLPPAVLLMKKGRKSLRRRYHPVAGTFIHRLLNSRRLHHYHTELSRRHKTFRILSFPFQSEVYTNDPAVIEHVVRTNFNNYGKGMRNYEIMSDLLGDGFIAVDGSKWRHQRKLASYEFSTRSLREHSGAVFRKNAVKLARAVGEVATSHQAIEVQSWFSKLALDSIVEVALGIQLNCLQSPSKENGLFVRALDDSSEQLNQRYLNPFWKLMKLFNIGSEAALKDNIRVVDDYMYKLIHSKIAEMGKGSKVEKEDILSRFLLESERDPKNLSHQYLRDIALNFVIAGKDSTGSTLAWFFYMLCKYPFVQEKVAQEVKEVVRASENASFQEFVASITEESLEKFQYLHAALSETLRLYPAVPMNQKVCFSDDTLPDGFDMREGETISYQSYCMGRMKYIWGEDAENFRPERWLDTNGIFCPESPFKFIAFQGGPRACLGKEFAYREMKIVTAVLLRFFTFQLRNEAETINYRVCLTLPIDEEGLHLHVFQR